MLRSSTRSPKTTSTAKLQSLLDDPVARQQLAARAKQRADALYRWDVIAQKYEELFEEMIKK